MGHAVHSMLANNNNPYETAGYSTFIAEMASTINEILLQEYMITNARTTKNVYYLGGALEQIRGTFFRQTMFAEFELKIHEVAESGQPLTGPKFSEIYGDLLKRYHGHDLGVLSIDDAYKAEWAYYRTSTMTSMFFSTPLRLVGLLGSRNNSLPVMAQSEMHLFVCSVQVVPTIRTKYCLTRRA